MDAVGNVIGRYQAGTAGARTLMTGSHYDTVRNGGKYDGRLGIFTPMACVKELAARPSTAFDIEVIGFAEEEGTALQSDLPGFRCAFHRCVRHRLAEPEGCRRRHDAQAMQHAGLCVDDIPRLRRNPADYLGFIEVHIEQGPVLAEIDLPLGVVTSINGACVSGEVIGMASHARAQRR